MFPERHSTPCGGQHQDLHSRICPRPSTHLQAHALDQTSRQQQMPPPASTSQTPTGIFFSAAQLIPLAHRACPPNTGWSPCHPPHPAWSGSHSTMHPRCPLQPTLSDASQRSQTHLLSACQLREQNRFQHLPKGCFSKQWTQIQGRHILEDPNIDQAKQSGNRWLKLILHHLSTHLWQLWLACNGDLHGWDKEEKERKCLQKL